MRPIFTQQQTSLGSVATSVLCQKRTLLREQRSKRCQNRVLADGKSCLEWVGKANQWGHEWLEPSQLLAT